MSKVVIVTLIAIGSALSVARYLLPDEAETMSVAVLPFVDSSTSVDDKYFAEGLREEVLRGLVSAGANAAASNSSFELQGGSVKPSEIAKRLRVDAVLDLSIRRHGENMRATATLFDATKRAVVWTQTFQGPTADSFALQANLSSSIIENVNLILDK